MAGAAWKVDGGTGSSLSCFVKVETAKGGSWLKLLSGLLEVDINSGGSGLK